MERTFLTFNTIQTICLSIIGIALTICTLALIFRQGDAKVIEAKDGTRFRTQEACDSYETALEKLMPLYEENDSNLDKAFGFNQGFLELLKKDGFNDLKKLLKYRSDFQKLVELLNEEKYSAVSQK